MTEPTHIRRDLERLAEARALLDRCQGLFERIALSRKLGAHGAEVVDIVNEIEDTKRAWLAHDDEERDDAN